jgi:hypothetical protein
MSGVPPTTPRSFASRINDISAAYITWRIALAIGSSSSRELPQRFPTMEVARRRFG